jgi:hypothetical protein
MTIQEAARTMISILQSISRNQDEDSTDIDPLVLLSFDEAHTLSKKLPSNQQENLSSQNTLNNTNDVGPSYFSCLRCQLQKLCNEPIFSVFLSTTGALFQFVPAKVADPSSQVAGGSLQLLEPFTDLGFDLLMEPIRENTKNPNDIIEMDFLIKFGRPLYVSISNYIHYPNGFALFIDLQHATIKVMMISS